MKNLDQLKEDLKLSVFGKQPHEELTPDEEWCMQGLDGPPADYKFDLDDPETKRNLSILLESDSDSELEESWQRFRQKYSSHFL